MAWFAPSEPALFTPGRFPVFLIESRHGIHYGLPAVRRGRHQGRQTHHRDEKVDPDEHDRTISAADEALIRAALADHLPAANGQLLNAKTCLYTMTPDGDSSSTGCPAHAGDRRLALLRPRLQIRAGDRRNPRRPRDERRDAPRPRAVFPCAVWLAHADPCILFDKDGTLIDFQRTWGPATHAVLAHFAGGDRAVFEELAAVSGFVAAEQRFLVDSPIISGMSPDFGTLWAQVLGQPRPPTSLPRSIACTT